MPPSLVSPANYVIGFFPVIRVTTTLTAAGLIFFAWIMARRTIPLLKAARENRFDRIPTRLFHVLIFWLGQKKHPRYLYAGIIHIIIFFGFLLLSVRTFSLAVTGIYPEFTFPGFSGTTGAMYRPAKDYAATLVLVACLLAAVRRLFFMPDRYRVPEKYGRQHTGEALLVLALISTLMITEGLYEASLSVAALKKGALFHQPAPATLVQAFHFLLSPLSLQSLQTTHIASYLIHDATFFFFLCLLPFGKHFHVITSLPNVFFMRTEGGTIKPVLYGADEKKLGELDSFGVKKMEDFTWKGVLDFYSCVDCGRCSDNCPATTVGSPLSPRFISIKARDLIYRCYPVFGKKAESRPLMGTIYHESEIWACTTCGACEEECPVSIEYIDKMVDLRRGLVDEGRVPQTLQKPLKALEKRGNPFGKTEKKRSDWVKAFSKTCPVKSVDKGESFHTLFFVDSISSYDERMQQIARAAAGILSAAGEDFGILGKGEKESGNEVRRFGEEMLFQELKRHNTEAILKAGIKKIVTADPHALNTMTHDYTGLPPVEHISTFIVRAVASGMISLESVETPNQVYTYHDPCYLGRHNSLYDAPRRALDAIPGIQRVEMARCRDRAFCCGGGGLMLFYEPEAETRMGVVRVQMARDAGANVIVTACPFCLVNLEDALKVTGLDQELQVMDLTELIFKHLGFGSNKIHKIEKRQP